MILTKRLSKELFKEPPLGEPHIKIPDLSDKVVLVIGASRPSGFGYNFGKIAAREGNAKVILTASNKKRQKLLENCISNSSFKADTYACDVTDISSCERLEQHIENKYESLDAIVVTPAFLKRKYFTKNILWENIPKREKEKCRRVTVYPIRIIINKFQDLLAQSQGVIYGTSFSLPDFPGYVIGPAKKELEELVVDKLAPEFKEKGIRINILSLGPFKSVSSSVIPKYEAIETLQERLDCKASLGYMVRESVSTITHNLTGHIYHIDGGLHKTVALPENREIVMGVYKEHNIKI